jgi:cbb3-type cytochrome oxidase maturation protein
MDVIYTLIPGMIFLGLIMVVVLIWAVKKGQYDDMEGDGQRLLMDDDEEMMPGKKEQQTQQKTEADTGKKKAIDRRNWPDADDD